MTYNASRDVTEDLGNVYHYWVGARLAAMAAAEQANKAKAEYEQKLLGLMTQLGIAPELLPFVNVQWHTGIVTVQDQSPSVQASPLPPMVPATV